MTGKLVRGPSFLSDELGMFQTVPGSYMDPSSFGSETFLAFQMTYITRLGILLSNLEGRWCSRGYALGRENWWSQWKRVFPCRCDNAAELLLMFLRWLCIWVHFCNSVCACARKDNIPLLYQQKECHDHKAHAILTRGFQLEPLYCFWWEVV